VRIGVTGHQNLPTDIITTVTREIRAELRTFKDLTGISSLAVGADQIFAAIVLELGGELEVVIPAEGYESTFSDSTLRSYQRLLSRAREVHRLPFPEPSEEAFFVAGKEIVGMCQRLLAVWDGKPAQGLGGTADIVRYAKSEGVPVHVIWPHGATR
jgi:hypothetical protein